MDEGRNPEAVTQYVSNADEVADKRRSRRIVSRRSHDRQSEEHKRPEGKQRSFLIRFLQHHVECNSPEYDPNPQACENKQVVRIGRDRSNAYPLLVLARQEAHGYRISDAFSIEKELDLVLLRHGDTLDVGDLVPGMDVFTKILCYKKSFGCLMEPKGKCRFESETGN